MSERNCKNCACYIEVTLSALAPAQPQCRRNAPMPAQIRMERPVLNPITKQPMMGKDGKPKTEISVENVFLYAPTAPDKVCFDGWRPIGTPPGWRIFSVMGEDDISRYVKEHLNQQFGRLSPAPESD